MLDVLCLGLPRRILESGELMEEVTVVGFVESDEEVILLHVVPEGDAYIVGGNTEAAKVSAVTEARVVCTVSTGGNTPTATRILTDPRKVLLVVEEEPRRWPGENRQVVVWSVLPHPE